MDEFGCDYTCRTVGESINKHNIPDDWIAAFDAHDGIHPLIFILVGQVRKNSALMKLKLRIVRNRNEEYAACMVFTDRNTINFKIDYMQDLIKAMQTK